MTGIGPDISSVIGRERSNRESSYSVLPLGVGAMEGVAIDNAENGTSGCRSASQI